MKIVLERWNLKGSTSQESCLRLGVRQMKDIAMLAPGHGLRCSKIPSPPNQRLAEAIAGTDLTQKVPRRCRWWGPKPRQFEALRGEGCGAEKAGNSSLRYSQSSSAAAGSPVKFSPCATWNFDILHGGVLKEKRQAGEAARTTLSALCPWG